MATWFDKIGKWFQDKVFDNFRKETRDNNEGMGRFLNGIDNLWNSLTGAGLTDAQREANKYSAAQAEAEYDREVEFYEKYQSPKAMMSQGVNPFGISGSTGGHIASGGSPQSVAPQQSGMNILDLVQSIVGMQMANKQYKLEAKRVDISERLASAESRLMQSQANEANKRVEWYDVVTQSNVDEIKQRIAESKQRVNESLQNIKESISRIDVNNNTIQLGNARIELIGSEKELNVTKAALNRLDADKASLLMPYVQSRAEAEQALINAQSDEARMAAEKYMYDANVSMLKGMVEADLIDKGYYDSLVESADWKAAGAKRDYKWSPVNDLCSNFSKICVGVGSVVGGFKGTSSMPLHMAGQRSYVDNTDVPGFYL